MNEDPDPATNDAIRRVLDRTGLRTYLFAVRGVEGGFRVELEHPRGAAWRRVSFEVAGAELRAARRRPAREALAARWVSEHDLRAA